MKIEKGDYVRLRGLTEDQYHQVAKVFMDAGAEKGEYPDYSYTKIGFRFGIVGGALYHSVWDSDEASILDGKQLSVKDMLNPAPQYWDGKGEPEIGQLAMACNKSKYAISESFKQFLDLDVEIIGKFYFEEKLVVVIHNSKCGHKSISGYEKYLAPIKSEREIAIEEIQKLIFNYADSQPNVSQAAYLYDAGYRKTEGQQ